MLRLTRLTYVILVAICFTSTLAFSQESKKSGYPEWHLRDLYYHDAQGVLVQLELAPELLVEFVPSLKKEERATLVAELSPTAEREQPGDASRILLSFRGTTEPANLLGAANKIASSGKGEAWPVFFVENIEAVLAGIVIEPKTVLTSNRLLDRIRKYGNFTLRQAISEGNTWVFLLDEIKPPLNLLVLTNLIANDPWIKSAYPRFKFLHDPIVASVYVEPVSGTIGETRTATLKIKIFDPAITIAQNSQPEFGQGLFKPFQGSSSSPSTMREIPGYLFERVGSPAREPARMRKRSRIYTTSWQFKSYAIGEWTINPLTVSYVKKGVGVGEIKSSEFTFVVNSQIGNLKITDMPSPRPLIFATEKGAISVEVILPPVPTYWFDNLFSRADIVARYAKVAGMLMFLVSSVGLVIVAMCLFRERRGKMRIYSKKFERIAELLQEARRDSSYSKYQDVLSLMLVTLFPNLPSSSSWEDININDVCGVFGAENMARLEKAFGTLGKRFPRDFVPDSEETAKLHADLESILAFVKWVQRPKWGVR